MYKEYIKERENKEMIETEYGFCIYKINRDHVYIQDVYIKKEYRNQNKCTGFIEAVEDIGKKLGKDVSISSFCIIANNWRGGKEVLRKCGYKYFTKDKHNKMIYCIKEIK